MGAIFHVLRKKLHYVGPVAVEAKFFKHIGTTWHQFAVWADRKIGYAARCLLWKRRKTTSNQVMFFPFSHTVGCNLKYISDELIRRQAPLEIYWSVSNPNTKLDACEIASKEMYVSERVRRLVTGEKVGGRKLAYWQELWEKSAADYEAASYEKAVRSYQAAVSFARSRMEVSKPSPLPVTLNSDSEAGAASSGGLVTAIVCGADEICEGSYTLLRAADGTQKLLVFEAAPSPQELNDAAQVQTIQSYIEQHVHFVKTNLYAYFEAAATSRVLITNSLLGDKFYPFPTRKNQIIAQTWHGSLGIKRFDPAHYNTNVTWPVAAKRSGKLTTHIISNSDFEDRVFRETFWQNTPILKYGHARNDIFFPQSAGVREYLRREFCRKRGLSGEIRFALYAPTFRDDHNFAVYDLDAEQTIRALEERFGGTWKLLIRYHDNDKKNESKKNTVKSPDVIDVSKYPDMQSLLAFTDCGITDYSSWIYDYVLMRKPGFIFAMDRDHYNNERGFYFKLEDTPFPVAVNSDELEEKILGFDEDLFQRRVTEFLSDKGCMDDGNASARIADQVMEWCREASTEKR